MRRCRQFHAVLLSALSEMFKTCINSIKNTRLLSNPNTLKRLQWATAATGASLVVGYGAAQLVAPKDQSALEYIDSISTGILSKLQQSVEIHAFSTPDHGLHAPHYPFEFKKWWAGYDHHALRRGYQVYREICSACHSMEYIHWRNLVGVTHTEAESKEMAAEYQYKDGPNDNGEYFMRPGKLTDVLPAPYENDELARKANGGALPPDLSCIARARHGEEVCTLLFK